LSHNDLRPIDRFLPYTAFTLDMVGSFWLSAQGQMSHRAVISLTKGPQGFRIGSSHEVLTVFVVADGN